MKESELIKISNPAIVRKNFAAYKGKDNATLEISEKPDKKYKVTYNGKTTHFGSKLEDYSYHKNKIRQQAYLKRSAGIKGNWKADKYSANNLARALLWN
jgi:hypothetical protein